MNVVTSSIIQDIRRAKRGGKYPIKLRLTYQGIQKYFPLGIDLTLKEFEKSNKSDSRGRFKDNRLFFNGVESKAEKVIRSIEPFTFESFKLAFNKTTNIRKDVFDIFEEQLKNCVCSLTVILMIY